VALQCNSITPFLRATAYNSAIVRIMLYRPSACLSVRRMDHRTRSQAVARRADRTAKIVGVTWPRPRPLSGELFVRPIGISHTKLRTKFEVSIAQVAFEILRSKCIGVTSLTFQGWWERRCERRRDDAYKKKWTRRRVNSMRLTFTKYAFQASSPFRQPLTSLKVQQC